jgi:hypothetical protein
MLDPSPHRHGLPVIPGTDADGASFEGLSKFTQDSAVMGDRCHGQA